MENIIEFKSKDFRFGSMHKYGGRMFVTKSGKPSEVFELGAVDGDRRSGLPENVGRFGTWIFAKKTLEPHTDYVFRVEATCDGTLNDRSDLRIAVFDVNDCDDKAIYPLGQSRFAPSVSKKAADGGLVRVFELPYSTGDGAEYQINIFAYDCRVTLDTPAAPEEYASLGDCSYAEWQNSRAAAKSEASVRMPSEEQIKKLIRYKELQEDNVLYEEDYVRIKNAILCGLSDGIPIPEEPEEPDPYDDAEEPEEPDPYDDAEEPEEPDYEDDEDDDDDSVIDVRDKSYDENGFARLLERIGDGCVASVQDVNVTSAAGASYSADDMYQADGATLDFKGLDATTAAFSMVISKIGDGSNVVIRGSNEIVNEKQMNSDESERFDGTVISICDSQLSAFTACKIIAALGDGCNLEFRNCRITSDGAFLAKAFADDPDPSDGTLISFRGSSVPDELKKLVKAKAKNSEGFSYEF